MTFAIKSITKWVAKELRHVFFLSRRAPLPSDPEEILNIGSELIQVNGGEGHEDQGEDDKEEEEEEEKEEEDKESEKEEEDSDGDDKARDGSDKEEEEDEEEKGDKKEEVDDNAAAKKEGGGRFRVSNLFKGLKKWGEDSPVQVYVA